MGVVVSALPDEESGRALRVPFLGIFLVLTLCLAGWLGYEAVAAAGSHRQTAESVLTDYAEISLSSYTRAAAADLDVLVSEALEDVDGDLRDREGLPDPREIAWELDDAARRAGCEECRGIQSPVFVFAADLGTGRVRVRPDSVPAAAVLVLADTIRVRRPDVTRYEEGLLTAPESRFSSGPVAIGYGLAKDSLGGVRAAGFVMTADALEELFAAWFEDRRLLPEPIGGGLPNDSLLQVTVRAPDGTTIYTSPVDYPTTLSASGNLGPQNDGITVEVAIRPDQASQLVIGGLPNSRLPFLLTLMLLTLGVGAAALVRFRREAEFQRLRDEFVSGVSHELRTPLTQIRLFAELQEMDRLSSPEDRHRANEVIHREARRLSHLVENILQFSRLRHADEIAMPREDVELGEALEEGLDAMTPLLRDRSMSLRFESEPGLRVHANRDALTRVVVNLVDNAAKYGPPGQEIEVDVRSVDGRARLTVEDRGPGVPPKDRGRVWKAYRRLNRDVKAGRPGTGIGLSVVSELIGAHGGRTWVEAADGGGARFVVDLPVAENGTGRS